MHKQRENGGAAAKLTTGYIRVVHCRKQPYDVYIGRANRRYHLPQSKWSTPFVIGKDGTREDVLYKYEEWLLGNPELLKQLPELRGKTLGCWCAPRSCHGDVLKHYALKEDAEINLLLEGEDN